MKQIVKPLAVAVLATGSAIVLSVGSPQPSGPSASAAGASTLHSAPAGRPECTPRSTRPSSAKA